MGFLSTLLRIKDDCFGEYLKPLPWITENVISMVWEQPPKEAILNIISDNSAKISFAFELKAFEGISSSLLSTDIKFLHYDSFRKFEKALSEDYPDHAQFSRWWQQTAAASRITGECGRLFQIDFNQGPWEIPWELLFGLLTSDQLRQNTSIVRCIGQPQKECRNFSTEALRILIVRADAPTLNLGKDVENILTTWEGMEETVKKAVVKPEVVRADKNNIINALREHEPHLIWFLGHGYFDTETHLKFSEKVSVTAEEFAGFFDKAKHHPIFAVFWSCDTLKGRSFQYTNSPDLFRALTQKGVSTVVGMQSSIADEAAIVMATQLFRGLLHGLPLEWAIARARTWMYKPQNSNDNDENVTMDWAAPVVWTAERPVASLDWNISELDQLQLQLLGSVSIDQGLPNSGLDVEPPNIESVNRARGWFSSPITVVRGNPDSMDYRLWFLRTLKGIQSISQSAVLVITLEKMGTFRQNIQFWAQGFIARLEKSKIPDDYIDALSLLSSDAEIGWQRLCALDNLFLAIINPPPASEEWFWTPFFHNPKHRAILTQDDIPYRYRSMPLNYEKAIERLDQQNIDEAVLKHPLLMSTLAILNIPARIELLKKVDLTWDPDNLLQLWPNLFVKAFSGYIMRTEVRERVLSTINDDFLSRSRQTCLSLTESLGRTQDGYIQEFRIHLLMEQNMYDQALIELKSLWNLYHYQNDQLALLRIAMDRRFFSLRDYMNSWDWFNRSSIFLQFGIPRQAKFWLQKEADNFLDVPYKLSLQAELSKMEGNITLARSLIEQAFEQCCKNQINESLSEEDRKIATLDGLSYRHDKARLLQFYDNDYNGAIKEYESIITEIENRMESFNSPSTHLMAVVHRNLGECILDLCASPEDDFREANSHLQTALVLEEKVNSYSNLIAETYYQLSRLSEKQTQKQQGRQYLEMCITTAQVSHYGLMAVIAKNRLFWMDVAERNLIWNELTLRWDLISDFLKGYVRNSWAARTLLNTNIKMAVLLRREGKLKKGSELLHENLGILESNQFLRRKGDLDRIVQTLAGLQLFEDDLHGQHDYWGLLKTEFIETQTYVNKMGWSRYQDAWKGGN